jgi:hypothetical protein
MMVEPVNDHIDTTLQPKFLSDVAVQDGGAAVLGILCGIAPVPVLSHGLELPHGVDRGVSLSQLRDSSTATLRRKSQSTA